MAETFTIDGKQMKQCPGWEGNKFSCGRGNPRLIPAAAEICESCSRGMRKRGQSTRAAQEESERRRKEEIAKLERGVAKVREQPGISDLAVKGTLIPVIGAIETLTAGDLEKPDGYRSYYHAQPVYSEDRWQILRLIAGLPAKEDDA